MTPSRYVASALAVLGAAAAHGATAPPAGVVEARDCYVRDVAERARCVAIGVPLDRSDPDGERIRIEAAILPAAGAAKAPDPLVVLAGGPGQAASEYGGLAAAAFRDVRAHRDVVLFDQRGTGLSGRLDCELPDHLLFVLESPAAQEAIRACARRHGPRVVHYAVDEVVHDLEAMRAAVGAGRINLWGGSFGTRTAQHYARAYPDRVRTLLLDGALAPATPLFLTNAADAAAALDALFARCAADPACTERHPQPAQQLADALARAGSQETSVLSDPVTGRAIAIDVTRDLVAQSIRGALYVPAFATMLPDAIAAAAAGEYGPLFALNAQTSAWSLDTMSLPVTLAVLCAEEMHRVTPAQAARAGTGFTGDGYHRAWRAACDAWPHRALPAAFAEPVRADIPVLVLSGAADPATPPARGAEAAAQFPQHRHLVVANAAHGVSALGCVPSLIGTFVAEGSADHLDAACLDEIAWPPLPAAGHARAEDAR